MTKMIFVLIGTSLLAVGAISGASNARAQGSETYTTTWTATKLITVDSAGGWRDVGILRNVPIGVAEWQVDARAGVGGAQLFSETWKVPADNEILFDPATQNTTGTGFNQAEWIFANHIAVFGDTPDGGKVRYKFQSPSILNPGYKYTKDNAKVGGNGVQCATTTDSNCLMSRGSYGWEVYHSLSNLGSSRGRISASGVMMPLKWVVTGTIY